MINNDLTKAYQAAAALYGLINERDFYIILKKYFPNLTYEDYLNDLEERSKITEDLEKEGYVVKKSNDDYIIHFYFGPNQDKYLEELLEKQRGKDFYVPDSLEEFLNFADDPEAVLINPMVKVDLINFFNEYIHDLDKSIFLYRLTFVYRKDIKDVFDFLKEGGFVFQDDKQRERFLELLFKLQCSVRSKEDRGFCAVEVFEHSSRRKQVETLENIGEGLKRLFDPNLFSLDDFTGQIDENLDDDTKIILNKAIEDLFNDESKKA